MPTRSNAQLDELERVLEGTLHDSAVLPPAVVDGAFDALETIRASRAKIGTEATPSELAQFLCASEPDGPIPPVLMSRTTMRLSKRRILN